MRDLEDQRTTASENQGGLAVDAPGGGAGAEPPGGSGPAHGGSDGLGWRCANLSPHAGRHWWTTSEYLRVNGRVWFRVAGSCPENGGTARDERTCGREPPHVGSRQREDVRGFETCGARAPGRA